MAITNTGVVCKLLGIVRHTKKKSSVLQMELWKLSVDFFGFVLFSGITYTWRETKIGKRTGAGTEVEKPATS